MDISKHGVRKYKKMTISVIVPIYRGSKYIDNIIKMMNANASNLQKSYGLELILVNDWPDEAIDDRVSECIDYIENLAENLHIITICNNVNSGIHQSRVNGLNASSGEYILFLDQDDLIADNFFASQLNKIGDAAVVVANGMEQLENSDKHLYKYRFMHETVKHIWFYTKFDNRIISPGQCLIRRTYIPECWSKLILKNSGSDDYMRWLLMLSENSNFVVNREKLYTHVYTSVNASLDNNLIEKSVKEVLNNIGENIGDKNCRLIMERLNARRKGKKINCG